MIYITDEELGGGVGHSISEVFVTESRPPTGVGKLSVHSVYDQELIPQYVLFITSDYQFILPMASGPKSEQV